MMYVFVVHEILFLHGPEWQCHMTVRWTLELVDGSGLRSMRMAVNSVGLPSARCGMNAKQRLWSRPR